MLAEPWNREAAGLRSRLNISPDPGIDLVFHSKRRNLGGDFLLDGILELIVPLS
jgi:hypothetical protein